MIQEVMKLVVRMKLRISDNLGDNKRVGSVC